MKFRIRPRKKPRHYEAPEEIVVDAKPWEFVGEVLVYVIGATVKERLWRAILIGVATAATGYYADAPEPAAPVPVHAPQK